MKNLFIALFLLITTSSFVFADNTATLESGDSIDCGAGGVTVDANDEGWFWPRGTDCSSAIGDGQACYDTSAKAIYIGDGSTANAQANPFGNTVDDDELTSEDFGDFSCDGTEDGCTLNDDTVAAAEMADADHGDISWTSGVATVEDIQCTDCVTAADIADATTTDTKTIWFENPTAADDFKSVWSPNGFAATITKIWCESDQTVNMDLQVDDGTPADVNGTDLVCDATPAEDESMGGDATLADGDRLDLAITSVSDTPTWVSIIFTYTVDD